MGQSQMGIQSVFRIRTEGDSRRVILVACFVGWAVTTLLGLCLLPLPVSELAVSLFAGPMIAGLAIYWIKVKVLGPDETMPWPDVPMRESMGAFVVMLLVQLTMFAIAITGLILGRAGLVNLSATVLMVQVGLQYAYFSMMKS